MAAEHPCVFREGGVNRHLWVKLGVLNVCVKVDGVVTGCGKVDTAGYCMQRVDMSRVLKRVVTGCTVGVHQGIEVVQGMLSHAAEDFGGSAGALRKSFIIWIVKC